MKRWNSWEKYPKIRNWLSQLNERFLCRLNLSLLFSRPFYISGPMDSVMFSIFTTSQITYDDRHILIRKLRLDMHPNTAIRFEFDDFLIGNTFCMRYNLHAYYYGWTEQNEMKPIWLMASMDRNDNQKPKKKKKLWMNLHRQNSKRMHSRMAPYKRWIKELSILWWSARKFNATGKGTANICNVYTKKKKKRLTNALFAVCH